MIPTLLLGVLWGAVLVFNWKYGLLLTPFLVYHTVVKLGLGASDNSGYIYFLLDPDTRRVKIGRTSRPPTARIRELAPQSSGQLELVHHYYTKDAPREEKRLHELLQPYHLHHEWYDSASVAAVVGRGWHTLPQPG